MKWLIAIAWFLFGTAVVFVLPLYLEVKLLLWLGVGWYADKLRQNDDQATFWQSVKGLLVWVIVAAAVWLALGVLMCLPFYPGEPEMGAKLRIWAIAGVLAVWAASASESWLGRRVSRSDHPSEWPTA
ncbi:hypothetical protein [Ralstonia pseudosolanacearum]|uniref:hypothetical protein n=1 Tax=Ralstonia pseudosolanacearum TaxID=1310165 RepID=UPI001FFBAC44|nr:hypothetical protein [Ralstonia pseudosolanacearum]